MKTFHVRCVDILTHADVVYTLAVYREGANMTFCLVSAFYKHLGQEEVDLDHLPLCVLQVGPAQFNLISIGYIIYLQDAICAKHFLYVVLQVSWVFIQNFRYSLN